MTDNEVIVYKVETPIHDSIRELVTWECKEHGVKWETQVCERRAESGERRAEIGERKI